MRAASTTFPAGGGRGGLDFSYRFKYPFIVDTNFHLSLGIDSPIIARGLWLKDAYRYSDYEPAKIPSSASSPPLIPRQRGTNHQRLRMPACLDQIQRKDRDFAKGLNGNVYFNISVAC